MSACGSRGWRRGLLAAVAVACLAAPSAAAGEEATWRSEQPTPSGSSWPIALGTVGDIEFQKDNRGLLITAGQPKTIPAGIWVYNGEGWHEMATECGATEGRIAWSGPDEFWTVSDSRPGQVSVITGASELEAPLADNSLCHFADGRIVGSYAHLAFQPDSYQAMHAAACLSPTDCWFGGDSLPEPLIGAFHLHWNGSALEEEPYPEESHAVFDMTPFEGSLIESVRVRAEDRHTVEEAAPPVLHRINPEGVPPAFEREDEGGAGLPLYSEHELVNALEYLHLSSADELLWAAAGRKYASEATGPELGQLTVAVREGGLWRQLLGPAHPLGPIFPASEAAEENQFAYQKEKGEATKAVVTALAAEPGSSSAWLGLAGAEPGKSKRAVLVHVSSEGELLQEVTLPSQREQEEGIGPKGPAARIACPAPNDCWMATTEGWLFHLAPEGERTLPRDSEPPDFRGLITERPRDQGLPQLTADAPPADTSGLVELGVANTAVLKEQKSSTENKVALPLLSRVRSRLINGSTLELRFHLTVKARVRLLAKRRSKVIAATRRFTFAAGTRKLLLALDPHRWPTALSLQTHALAPLPLVSSVTGEGVNVGTLSTGMHTVELPASPFQIGSALP
jgi:hypothetical protein